MPHTKAKGTKLSVKPKKVTKAKAADSGTPPPPPPPVDHPKKPGS